MLLALLLATGLGVLAGPNPELDLPVAPPPQDFDKPPQQPHRETKKRADGVPIPPIRGDEDDDGEDPPDVPPPVIYGEALEGAESVVYVLDRSCSMAATDSPPFVNVTGHVRHGASRLEYARNEVLKSVYQLQPDRHRFAVGSYSCGPEHWIQPGLTRAIRGEKNRTALWLGKLEPFGGTGTGWAVVDALKMQPDVVVLITDGVPGCTADLSERYDYHAALIRDANTSSIPIHVFGVALRGNPFAKAFCVRVASESGGKYREVQ